MSNFTHTTLKFDDQHGVTHELDFSDKPMFYKKIIESIIYGPTMELRIEINGRVHEILSTQLYY